MNIDFLNPQRQSKTGILVLFLYSLMQYSKALFPIFLVYFIKQNKLHLNYAIIGMVAIVVLIAIVSYLKFINFTFYIDQERSQFIITEGILTKTITSIQLNKIQQVNIDQSFLHKLIGTFELSIDAAGSNKNESNIRAISYQMAVALKTRLLENENVAINENIDEIEVEIDTDQSVQKSFLKIKLPTLIKVGLTSSYGKSLALIMLFLSTIFHNFGQYFDYDVVENLAEENKINQLTDKIFLIELLMGFLFLSLLIVIVVNLFRTIFKFYNFDISKQNDAMLFSYGLLNSKSIIIKYKKVQIVAVTQNFVQKKMHLSEIAISHAATLHQQQNDKKKAMLEIPGCNDQATVEILQLIFGDVPKPKISMRPNFRKFAFSVFIFVAIPIAIFYGLRYSVLQELYLFSYFTFV